MGCGQMTPEAQRRMNAEMGRDIPLPVNHRPPQPQEPKQLPIQAPRIPGKAFSDWLTSLIQPHGYDGMGKRLWFPRTRRLARWLSGLIWKGLERRRVTRGPRASDDLYAARLAICIGCPGLLSRAEHVGYSAGGKLWVARLYCSPCRCGENEAAELRTKLTFLNHECPMGRHPDGWGQLLEQEKADARAAEDDGDDAAGDGGDGADAGADTSTASAR